MKDIFTNKAGHFLENVESKMSALEERMEEFITPTRKNVLERFPILFALLTTAGVVITFLGIELLVAQWTWLYSKPWLVLTVGVTILVATGTLFKKLG